MRPRPKRKTGTRGKGAKPALPIYSRPSFLTKRKPGVAVKLSQLLTIIQNKSESSSVKRAAHTSYTDIAWFDQKRYRAFLTKLIKFCQLSLEVDITEILNHLISEFEYRCLTRGPVDALKFFKELYNIGIRFACSTSFSSPSFTKVTASGLPKILGPLETMLRGSLNERRSAVIALQVFKLVGKWSDDYGLETIVREHHIAMESDKESVRIGNYFSRVFDKFPEKWAGIDFYKFRRAYSSVLEEMFPNSGLRDRIEDIRKLSRLHLSAKNGPNGPCLSTVVLDHDAIARCPTLYGHIRKMIELSKHKDLAIVLDNFDEEAYTYFNTKEVSRRPIHSKINLKRESWGKVRAFATVDYFSHSALAGYHEYLFRWLDNQVEDGTYDQDRVSELVRSWTARGFNCESSDLSAATDSIPVEIQQEIAMKIAGRMFGSTWRGICTARDFVGPNGEVVHYASGQPMGILSSWAMLAVWHHVMYRTIIRYLDLSESEEPYYCVIGDDSSTRLSSIFLIYKQVVSEVQQVGISISKGYHTVSQTEANRLPELDSSQPMVTAEIAKRVYCSGYELTSVPPDELLNSFEDPVAFAELINSMKKRQLSKVQDISGVYDLASLSRDKKTALLLTTLPWAGQPLSLEGSTENMEALSHLPWFKPGFEIARLNELFQIQVRQEVIGSLLRTTSNLSQWKEEALRGGEITVKSWTYTCESQGVILWFVSSDAIRQVDRILSDLEPLSKELLLNNWSAFYKELRTLVTLFSLADLYKEGTSGKKADRFKYLSNFRLSTLKKIIPLLPP